ncbi:amidase [Streptomyces sp. NPDC005799]|uniref:amidase n=1 Tax=Streptomyces sp. NPDC005799 TaxID=3154678 RepID=UPI0033DA885C
MPAMKPPAIFKSSRRRTRAIVIGLAIGIATPSLMGYSLPPRYLTSTPAVVDLGIADVRQMLNRHETTSKALVKAYLDRIDAYENTYGNQPGINAIITVNRHAMAEAAELDAERRAGHIRGPLHGVPIVVKDNYDTVDMPTTAGSESLKSFQPRYDSTQVKRLRAAGAIIIAKTNLHEFAAGVTTISSLGGQTRDPYDQTRNPGGSSGGTAAAVASSFAAAGLGTDTCGSIRLPASYNNLVGLRPTKGLTSISGVAPLSSTQDVTGPMTKTVEDAALLLDVMAGYDPEDPATSAAKGKASTHYERTLSKTALKGKRIALLTDKLGTSSAEKPTSDIIRAAADKFRSQGATVVELQLPQTLVDALAGARTTTFEFQRDLNAWLAQPGARYDAQVASLTAPADKLTLSDIIKSGEVTPTVLTKIKQYAAVAESSTYDADYAKALANRKTAAAELKELFAENRLDAMMYPEIKATAGKIDDTNLPADNCGISPYTGFPALNVPAGFSSDTQMPVGVELLGLPFTESKLLSMGYDYEQATNFRTTPDSVPELFPAPR